jgi:hypothetical protein
MMKATKADIICFTTSQQISNIGDQMQALMVYDNPVMALEDLGQSVSDEKWQANRLYMFNSITCSCIGLSATSTNLISSKHR